ncbi:MAG: bifunctional alpha,alpha-trehalose-phosphate synthase (UDP-forming)/trehalose-phosphatase [Candidatus Saccharimonadales bacterium]
MILPQLLRAELPHASIGFFLHIPFPSYEIFRLLPQRKEIIEGLLGADLVGFHTYDYARHFLSGVLRTLGLDNKQSSVVFGDRLVRADVFPIGIDYEKFTSATVSAPVKAEINSLNEHFQSQKLILSVDRLDYSKGILQRLEAYEYFLQTHPRWLKKITLVVVAVPSRTDIHAYQHMREEIERAVSRINGDFATMDWSPISYQYKNVPFNQLVALYARADVALITPIRDGMNLVAKEYIATKLKRGGVLIISEMAGVADELPEALRVNPSDRPGIASAIETALKMPAAEQRRRLSAMQHRLSVYSVQRWAEDFIEQLSAAKTRRTVYDLRLVDEDITREIIELYKSSKNRLLMFDYDGTLTNFVSDIDPNSAKPSQPLMRLLKKLSAVPENDVTIISGRPRLALDSWFAKLPVKLAAEHGAWLKEGNTWTATAELADDWKKPLLDILITTTERTPGSLLEGKHFSLVWHYRNVTPELAYVRKATLKHDCEKILRDSDIEIFQGNKILEFKPRGITKGAVAKTLMGSENHDFILAIGDDYTDEDLFAALPPHAITIKVGLNDSDARYHVTSVEQVKKLLARLAAQ